MKYRGFEIKNEQLHYVVIMQCPPDRGIEWREDTVEDAKREIDKFWEGITHESSTRVYIDEFWEG